MKKHLLITFLLIALFSSVFGQTNSFLNKQVPRAGEFLENSQQHTEQHNDYIKGSPGYDSLRMSFQGNWPFGSGNNIESSITGDTIFVVAGGGVLIVDITTPDSPQLISEVRARANVDHIYFDYATQQLYLAAYFSGFEIWDLNDFTNPFRLSRTPTEALPRGGIYAYENYLYVITVSGGMLVYNITNPSNPLLLTTTPISGSAWNSYGKDNFLYISTNSAIRLYDLTDPTAPVLRDSYSCSPKGLFVKDGLCYIANNSSFVITDVSNPDDITLVGSLSLPGSAYDVAVIEDFAYIANNYYGGDGGVYTIDVSDPATPIQRDYYDDYFSNITGKNNKIIAINNDAYSIFGLTDPNIPELIGNNNIPGFLKDIAIKDDYAFTGSNGFRVFDVSDAGAPEQVAFVDIAAGAVDISGDKLAYIPESMGAGNRFSLMDISDPENSYEIGHYNNLSLTQDAIIKDDYVYIGGWWDGFTVLNITNPASPYFVTKRHNWTNGATPGEDWCFVSDLDVEGDYLYLIDYKPFEDDDTKGLYIFDISDPSDPVFISRYEQQSQQSWRIKVQWDHVFLADAYGGIEIIDVSDPYAPQTVAYKELMDVAYNLDVANGFVYASCYILGGVQAVDISDITNPLLDGYYYRSGLFALNVTADDHNIYICDGSSGFQVYRHDVEFTGIGENSINENNIKTYPNPSSGMINIDVEDATEVVVFDQAGKFLMKQKISNINVSCDLSALSNGVYFLKIKTTTGIQLQKVVISK